MINGFAYSKSMKCQFEEVYKTGEVNFGKLYIQENKLRYEYEEDNLYTIIYDFYGNLYSVLNDNNKKIQAIERNKNLFTTLINLTKDYPNIPNKLLLEGMEINIENSQNSKFIKRIAVKSDQLNVSIFFYDCIAQEINHKLFIVSPFIKE